MRSDRPKRSAANHSSEAAGWKLAITALASLLLFPFPWRFKTQAAAEPNPPIGVLFTVTTIDDHDDGSCDGSDCTLREAIQAANNAPTADTIAE